MILEVANIDFNSLKESFKRFLKAQDFFKDYNVEGSTLSHLLDVLAYAAHHNGWYHNMVANEIFLDTAQLRSSVVSLAKHLAYTPRSANSAIAVVDITITPPNGAPAVLIIDKGTKFNTTIDGKSYTFQTIDSHVATANNGSYSFPGITLKEGRPYSLSFQVTGEEYRPKFTIPNKTVDTTTIDVRIQQSFTNVQTDVYKYYDNIVLIDRDSAIFFLEENQLEQYQVSFGDGILGAAPVPGNIVLIDYLVSNAEAANGASVFVPAGKVATYPAGNVTIRTVQVAHGGANPETIEQIKFYAPRFFESQNRAVTVPDYRTSIIRDYPLIDSVAVWGGQDNVPPMYGKVFVSLKPVNGYVVTSNIKKTIKNLLKNQNMVTAIPDILDPDYTFVLIDTKVYYDQTTTNKTAADITAITRQAISFYNKQELGKFEHILKFSRLSAAVDDGDAAITNNATSLRLQKRFTPLLRATRTHDMDFNSSVVPGTLITSTFVVARDPLIKYSNGDTHYIQDDGLGNLWIFKKTASSQNVTAVKKTGTIDYATGVLTISKLLPETLNGNSEMTVTVTPAQFDIVPQRNTILYIEDAGVTVTTLLIGSLTGA